MKEERKNKLLGRFMESKILEFLQFYRKMANEGIPKVIQDQDLERLSEKFKNEIIDSLS